MKSETLLVVIILMLLLAALAVAYWMLLRSTRRLVSRALRREKRALADREQVVHFLNRFASSIVTSRNTAEWMWSIAKHLADILHARTVRIYMLEGKNLRRIADTGKLPIPNEDDYRLNRSNRLIAELSRTVVPLDAGMLGDVVLSGKSQLRTELCGDPRTLPSDYIDTYMAVPLRIDSRTVGVVAAVNTRSRNTEFSQDDLFLMETLSHQVALGETLIHVFEELSEQQRIQQELQLAQRMQISLLPQEAPESDQFQLHAVNKPAGEVSGDYYDFFDVDENNLLVVIADGSGKGVSACMLMTMCRSLVRNNAKRYCNDLSGLLKEVNQRLFDDTDSTQFVTMACCLINRTDNTVEYVRAGHTELVIRAPDGDMQVIAPDGPALGLLPNDMGIEFDTFYFSWLPGTSMLMFTDGITEAMDDQGEEFGIQNLMNAWRPWGDDPVAATSRILKEVNDFTQPRLQDDDQTLLVLRRLGSVH